MPLFLGLAALILVEIGLFVVIGGRIGLGLTLLEVVVTAIAGALILRGVGRGIADRLMAAAMDRRNPVPLAGDGMLLAVSGILLILPGFLTDGLGLLLLLPMVRQALLSRLGAAFRMGAAMEGDPGPAAGQDAMDPMPPHPVPPGKRSPWAGTAEPEEAEVIQDSPSPASRPGSEA